MLALATILVKYAGEFSLSDAYSHTRASCKWQAIKDEPLSRTYRKQQQKAISLI